MNETDAIPAFELFGETARFPDVLHCEEIKDRASEHGWTISPHRHHHMAQLLYIAAGRTEARLDGDAVILDGDSWLFVPAKTVHGFAFAPDTEGVVLTFPVNVVNSVGPLATGLHHSLAKPMVRKSDDRLTALILLFARCYSDTGIYRAQVAVGLAHAILAAVAESGHTNGDQSQRRGRRRLLQLDALIAEHLADGWGAGDYASALSLSTGQLNRICRGDKGMSTSSYLEASAMAEACRLLAFTNTSIADIGYRLGFDDPSYFSRKFRATHRQTPSDYRLNFFDT